MQCTDPFLQGVLDAIPLSVVILDSSGRISATNEQWRSLARAYGLQDLSPVGVGVDYLDTCRKAVESGDDLAQDILRGLEQILDGRSRRLAFEYPCHSPGGRRWYVMEAAPFGTGERHAVIVHLDITERQLAREALQSANSELEERVRERTAQLTRSNEQLTREIKEREHVEERLRKALLDIEQYRAQLEAECTYLREEIRSEHNFDQIIGKSDALKYVFYKVKQIAPTDTIVLILGETGTGKELVARAIHSASGRKDHPLVKVNCAALPANLIESELFGHEKGAFTGALSRRVGRFELADGGTLFLDEIGEMPMELQAKLLRVLQDREFERLGNARTIKVDVRILAATNRNLEQEVREGRFRQDLWYRINVFPITLPPLRQRKEDIPLLARAFVDKFSKKVGRRIAIIPQELLEALTNYPWPGNIRELENVVERAVISTEGLVLQLGAPLLSSRSVPLETDGATGRSLEDVEREHILRVLERTRWRIEGENGAAGILDLHPSTLRGRLRKLGISRK